MSREEPAIFTVMCMIYDGNGNILVENRRKSDWPGVTFPGGHVERGESFTKAAVREVKEETGLDIASPLLCGVKQFQTDEDARYVVLFYKTCRFSGELRSSDEGEVFWIPRADLEKYPLSNDFAEMVRVFESDDLSEFCYRWEAGRWDIKLL